MDAPSPSIKPSRPDKPSSTHSFVLSPITKVTVLALCTVVMIAASVYAVLQPLRPDPGQQTRWQAFWYPVETNPFSRLQAVSCADDYACRLNDITAVGSGPREEVWAVGNVGLVLHKSAGQKAWQQIQIHAAPQLQVPAAARERKAEPLRLPTPPTTIKPPSKSSTARPKAAASLLQQLSDVLAPRAYAAERPPKQRQAADPTQQQISAQQPMNAQQVQQSPVDQTAPHTKNWTPPSQQNIQNAPAGLLPDPSQRAIQQPNFPNAVSQSLPLRSQPHREPAKSAPSFRSNLRSSGKQSSTSAAAQPINDDLLAIFCNSATECLIAGRSGRIYSTADGGTSWAYSQLSLRGPEFDLSGQTILRARFRRIPGSPLAFAFDVANINAHQLLNISYQLQPADSNAVPQFVVSGTTSLHGVSNTNNGVVLSKADSGEEIFDKRGESTEWLAGSSGYLATGPAATTSRQRIESKTQANLRAVAAENSKDDIWVAGDNGTILSSIDKGEHWRHETRGLNAGVANHRWPAPWYWLLAAIVLGVCFKVISAPEPTLATESSVADWTVTDAPLKPGERDALDFTPVVLGLSRFIRNPKTQPPVTIAIEGKWGEGKSSLMNLLCGDLKKSRFRPVWFNAWHHQTEEQLLASLLEHIRVQGVPPWWHFDNWVFRARLLHIRFGQMWPIMVMVGLFVIGSASYEFAHQQEQGHLTPGQTAVHTVALVKSAWDSFWTNVRQVEQKDKTQNPEEIPAPQPKAQQAAAEKPPTSKPSAENSGTEKPGSTGVDPGSYTLAGSILGLFIAIYKKFRAFAADPGKLAENLKEGSSITDLKIDPGIRRQFAREFKDICEAWSWGGRRVIIFIDDLDRCRPDSVVTVLESVNFLTTAGDCIVVMGIAEEIVTHCVGLSFKEIAESHAFYDGCADTEQARATARFNYGENYIKKLINISARLPRTSAEQRQRVLDARLEKQKIKEQDEQQQTWRDRLWRQLERNGRAVWKFAPVWAIVLLVIASVTLGYRAGTLSEKLESRVAEVQQPDNTGVSSSPEKKPESPKTTGTALSYQRQTDQQATLGSSPDGNTAPMLWSWYFLSPAVPLLLAGLIIYVVTTRSNQDAENSPEFEMALGIWGTLIAGACETPRELKRALNDLRYQAMMRRKEGSSTTRIERLLSRLKKLVTGRDSGPAEEFHVYEADLPARKAFELISMLSDADRARLMNRNDLNSYPQDSAIFKTLMEAKIRHIEHFHTWIAPAVAAAAQ